MNVHFLRDFNSNRSAGIKTIVCQFVMNIRGNQYKNKTSFTQQHNQLLDVRESGAQNRADKS
jgi:hypothetical protein